MRKRTLTFTLIAAMAMSTGIAAQAADEGPSKVWICHFEDNHEREPWTAAEGELNGDYVINWHAPDGAPGDYCGNHGGEPILVSVNAVGTEDTPRGHGAQLTERIGDYPDGWKG